MTAPLQLDDVLRADLHLAIRALEDQAAAARASAELVGSAAPEAEAYLDAATRLRAVAHR